MANHGGKREGSGRKNPHLKPEEKRRQVTIRLHPKIIAWLKNQETTQAKTVEKLVCEKSGIIL